MPNLLPPAPALDDVLFKHAPKLKTKAEAAAKSINKLQKDLNENAANANAAQSVDIESDEFACLSAGGFALDAKIQILHKVLRFRKGPWAEFLIATHDALAAESTRAHEKWEEAKLKAAAELGAIGYAKPVSGVANPTSWTPEFIHRHPAVHGTMVHSKSMSSRLNNHSRAEENGAAVDSILAELEQIRDQHIRPAIINPSLPAAAPRNR